MMGEYQGCVCMSSLAIDEVFSVNFYAFYRFLAT